ncbi:MAG: CHAT domain-containing protein [Winogradskyella sp.]|uniref:CHAT domain-containing protein n=1 Tax=Winogradskyella sp. TaxID=1883156 RepID=UPI0017C437CF|nr:CHAT domain-containing protein [Winogradskyella sp.]
MKLEKRLLFSLLFSCLFLLNAQDLKRKHWKSLHDQGLKFYKQDSFEQAHALLKDAFTIAQLYDINKDKYGSSLYYYYKVNIATNNFNLIDSLTLTQKLIDFSEHLRANKRIAYSKKIGTVADLMMHNGKFKAATALYKKRKDDLEKEGLVTDSIYAKTLYGLGKSYIGTGEHYTMAKTYLEQALDLIYSLPSIEALQPNAIRLELMLCYHRLGEITESKKIIQKALDASIAKSGKISKGHGILLSKIGINYFDLGLYKDAYNSESRAVKIFEEISYKHYDYMVANYYLGYLEEYLNNNYLVAIDNYKIAKHYYETENKTDDQIFAAILGRIALNYDKIGDYENAIKFCKQALSAPAISEKTKSIRLMDLGYFYYNMGQYALAHRTYEDALTAMKISHDDSHSEYAKLLNNIGKLYFEENNFEEALAYFETALTKIKAHKNHSEEKWHDFYSYFLNDYAKTLFEMGKTEESIKLLKKNLDYFDSNDKPKNEAYFNRKYSLAKAYNLLGNYNDALPLIKEATENLGKMLGKDHVDYGNFLKTLSETYFGLGNNDKGVATLEASNTVFISQVDKIFRFSSENEKQAFLKMLTRNFNQMQSIATHTKVNHHGLNAVNLNNQLMLKGLLLNNSKDITFKLKSLNDEEINNKIKTYRILKSKFSKLITQYDSKRKQDLDSLKLLLNAKEVELVRLYTTNFKDGISLQRDWKRIKDRLKPDEVAIEFSHFNLTKDNKLSDEVMYVAYLIRPLVEFPKLILLFKESELKQLKFKKTNDQLYSNSALYQLIWKPLSEHLKNTSKIYYAPSGMLNEISYAAIYDGEDALINRYNLVQLSSTYKLFEAAAPLRKTSTLLIGGITYDYALQKDNKSSTAMAAKQSFLDNMAFSQSRGTKNRGESWEYLEGTSQEVDNLNKLLKTNKTEVAVLTTTEATEANFKSISGNSPNLIHIATHGFFFENLNRDRSQESNLSTEDNYRLAFDPLLRSGLIMAGANYAWKHNNYPPGEEEDGILTALEISNLDLSNTDLVVLSACKTGLGDIDGSEGVYGLQRAFKMAGVDKLIMSLWEVPDAETAIFMKTFYNNWLEGTAIRDAFNNTQRQLYNRYKSEPHKWAAFVLFE